jgi:hypothetical protein
VRLSRLRAVAGAALAAGVILGGAPMAPAGVAIAATPAAPACGQPSDYTVPEGVWLVEVALTGASGASSGGGGGGLGGRVNGTVAVFPGQHLSVLLGCTGDGFNGGAGYGPGGKGLAQPPGPSGSGGGGGGSALMVGTKVLVVAGGGGGGGTNFDTPGGNGGKPPQTTGRGGPNGGCGGCLSGNAGGNGNASLFAPFAGGGGGGGYRGGGGGSDTIGEGGGGGLSFTDPSVTGVVHSVAPSSGNGSVSFTPKSSTFSYGYACGPGVVSQAAPNMGWPFIQVDMTALGGTGGGNGVDPLGVDGGLGGTATGSVIVAAGSALQVAAGCAGRTWSYGTPNSNAGGVSGYGPGGAGGPDHANRAPLGNEIFGGYGGGGGGGASAVLKGNVPLLVAGGGGGSGSYYVADGSGGRGPTPGGNGGKPAGSGGDCAVVPGACFGGKGGSAASPAGQAGAAPAPCNGHVPPAAGSGGGGGGYRGGGAGTWPVCSAWLGSAGGGGGLSYADPSVTDIKFGTGTRPMSGSVGLNFHPVQVDTALSISSSVSAPVFGDAPTFTAKVTPSVPGGPVPAGTAQFNLDGAVLSSVVLDGTGSATSAPTPHLAVGTHRLSVTYSNGLVYRPSTATLPFTVAPKPPTIAVSFVPNPLQNGAGASVSATVAPAWAGGPAATGTVQFRVDGTSLGSYGMTSGTATSGTSEPVSYGAHTLTAAYSGDANYAPGTASVPAFARDETLLVLASSVALDTVFPWSKLTFTATVTPASQRGVVPTGTVTFTDAGVALTRPVTLVAGAATTLPIGHAGMAAGHHTITATYSGDQHFLPGQTTLVILVVGLTRPGSVSTTTTTPRRAGCAGQSTLACAGAARRWRPGP